MSIMPEMRSVYPTLSARGKTCLRAAIAIRHFVEGNPIDEEKRTTIRESVAWLQRLAQNIFTPSGLNVIEVDEDIFFHALLCPELARTRDLERIGDILSKVPERLTELKATLSGEPIEKIPREQLEQMQGIFLRASNDANLLQPILEELDLLTSIH